MRYRRYPRFLLLSLLIAGSLLLYAWSPAAPALPVEAHAFVIGSEPIDGSTVPVPPRVVRIFFNSEISVASHALVYDPTERVVNAASSFIAPGNSRELDTPLQPGLAQGSYLVRWTALASDDGRTTQGAIGFNIGHSSSGLPGQTILGPSTSNYLPSLDLPGVLAVAWDWLVMLALTFWVGLLVMEQLVIERKARTLDLLMRARVRAQPLQWLCLTALLVGEVVSLILRSTSLTRALEGGGIDLRDLEAVLFTTRYGPFWLARAVLVVIALLWLAWMSRRRTPGVATAGVARVLRGDGARFGRMRRQVLEEYRVTKELVTTEEAPAATASLPVSPWSTALWLAMAALYLLTFALTSDEAQLAQPHLSAIVFTWLYLAAQAVWLGGLAYLGFVLLPLLAVIEPDNHAELLVGLTRRLAPLLLTAIGVLCVAQLFLAEALLPGPQALLESAYGRSLLVRLALQGLMLLLSGLLLFRIGPRLARQTLLLPVVNAELPARRTRRGALLQTERHLKRLLQLQSWFGAAVLLCTALMNFYAPPPVFPNVDYAQVLQNQGVAASSGLAQTQQVGDLNVSLFVVPARVNVPNTLVVALSDARGAAVTDARVTLSVNMVLMDMGTASQSIDGGHPLYIATFAAGQTFDMQGLWRIAIRIERPARAPLQATFEVNLS